jgi:pimeloyl-ACP methyl ester carboxylesterase
MACVDRDPEGASQNRIIIYLVHGTWPRGFWFSQLFSKKRLSWFELTSEFARELSVQFEGFRAEIKAFLWSGSNAILDRANAAAELAAEVSRDLEAKDTVIVVIGHSHGGNVALKALRTVAQLDRIFLVTLGTPFFQITENEYDLTAVSAIAVVTGWLTLKNWYDPFLAYAGSWGLFGFLSIWIIGAPVLMLSSFFFNAIVFDHIWLLPFGIDRWQKISNALDHPRHSPSIWLRTLVIKVVADEASLIVMRATAATRALSLVQMVYASINRLLFPNSIFRTAIVYPLLITTISTVLGLDLKHSILVILFWYASFVIISQIVSSVLSTAYGREMVVGCSALKIWPADVPDTLDAAVITLQPSVSQGHDLQHSLYERQGLPELISVWIKRRLLVAPK